MSTVPSVNPFDYLVRPASADQEGLFPMGEISIIAGASGSGKTTWLLQFLRTWKHGEKFFGRETCPHPYLLVSKDRSEAGFIRTCRRMQIDPKSIPVYRPTKDFAEASADWMLEKLHKQDPRIKLFVFEGLDMWIKDGNVNDFGEVTRLLDNLQRKAEEYHVAIIGTVGSPKMKPKDKYKLHRDCIIGSTAWGRKTETIVYLQNLDPDNPNSARELWLLPRNGRNERFVFQFQGGVLVEIDPHEKAINWRGRIQEWITANFADGRDFDLDDFKDLKCPDATFFRELKNLQDDGFILKVKRGVYQLAVISAPHPEGEMMRVST